MSDNKDRPVAELSAYERWELPTIAGGKLKTNSFSNKPVEAPKPPTAEELEEIRQAAYQEGLQQGQQEGLANGNEQGLALGLEEGRKQGLDQGLQQGLDQARTQVNQQINQIHALLQQLADPVALQQEQVAQAMSNMATAIARSVIHRELQLDPTSLSQLAMQALDALPSDVKRVTISAHPSDHSLFEQALASSDLPIHLVADPAVHVGGCIISTNTQLIDYTVEKRFQRSIHTMLMNLSGSQQEGLVPDGPEAIESMGDFPSEELEQVEKELREKQQAEHEQASQESEVERNTLEPVSPEHVEQSHLDAAESALESEPESEPEPEPEQTQEHAAEQPHLADQALDQSVGQGQALDQDSPDEPLP